MDGAVYGTADLRVTLLHHDIYDCDGNKPL